MKLMKYQGSEGLMNYFDVRLAIIEVNPGETDEEAWNRHVKEHPEQSNANVRIFNIKTEAGKEISSSFVASPSTLLALFSAPPRRKMSGEDGSI